MAIVIYEKESQRRLFEITRAQLANLVAALEEEGEGDHDYYVDAALCDFLDGKIDAELIAKLRETLSAAGKASEPVVDALLDDGKAAGDEGDDEAEDGAPPEVESEDDGGIEIVWREE